jgi:hypothetical protein
MYNQIWFPLNAVASLLSFSLIAAWYGIPYLRTLPRVAALMPLLLIHTFRTFGLTFLVPQVLGGSLPAAFAVPAAVGDLLAAFLAFFSLLALRRRWPFALLLVWIFNLEGSFDLLTATFQGVRLHFPDYQVGPGWFIPTLYVPLLLVCHALIFWLLLRPSDRPETGSSLPAETADGVEGGRLRGSLAGR